MSHRFNRFNGDIVVSNLLDYYLGFTNHNMKEEKVIRAIHVIRG